ncbi:MAG: hypothetical protein E4G95_09680, partial [Bacteroidia bacterium]
KQIQKAEVVEVQSQGNEQQLPDGFRKTIAVKGITFEISATSSGSINRLVIQPSGLKIDNSHVEHEIMGSVTGVETADLNSDGSPELLVYVTSAGSGSYGTIIAYSVNNGRSMSQVYLPPVTDDLVASEGYMGHDVFMVSGNSLIRRFPVYKKNDTNVNPTGGTREIRYRIINGEASRIFIIDSIK